VGVRGRRSKLLHNTVTCAVPKADAEYSQLVSTYRKNGWLHIPAFLDEATTNALLAEASPLLDNQQTCFSSRDSHNVYQEEDDSRYDADHVRNRLHDSSKRIVDFERLNVSSPLRRVYNDPKLLELVRRCTGLEQLYTSACPYNAAYYNRYDEGDGLGWHFDNSQFGVNLVLQMPIAGGTFEFHKDTRSEEDRYSFQRVSDVLEGLSTGVVRVDDVKPGSLILFNGRNSLHRVSPVIGSRARINAILTYEQSPGKRLSAYSLSKFFGRSLESGG